MAETPDALAPEMLARLVAEHYDIGRITGCQLLHSGVNDTYSVEADAGRYAARFHKGQKWWIRSETDLLFELDLLDHLHADGVSVAYPIKGRAGQRLTTVDTHAGRRYLVLFSWASKMLAHDTDARLFRIGAAIASIHRSADSFRTPHPRSHHMDLSTLLDRYLDQLGLEDQPPDDVRFVHRQIAQIRQRITAFDPGPTGWGIIHGDVQPLNFHLDATGRVTFIDFDHCGYGWRAYEIAYYYTRIPKHLRGAMIRGYESVRPLTPEEHRLLPTFGRLAWIREEFRSADLVYRMRRPYQSFA